MLPCGRAKRAAPIGLGPEGNSPAISATYPLRTSKEPQSKAQSRQQRLGIGIAVAAPLPSKRITQANPLAPRTLTPSLTLPLWRLLRARGWLGRTAGKSRLPPAAKSTPPLRPTFTLTLGLMLPVLAPRKMMPNALAIEVEHGYAAACSVFFGGRPRRGFGSLPFVILLCGSAAAPLSRYSIATSRSLR